MANGASQISRNSALAFTTGRNFIVPACFTVTLIVQIVLTYVSLDPEVGFDDANITQVYARHIAEGHGYVYNVGGERVEGSTSLIWTLLNAALFLTPFPIFMITAVSFLLTAGTLAMSGRIARELGGSEGAVAVVYLLFNLFPGFFAWSLWSLMDITLWVFGITLLVWSVLRLERGGQSAFQPLAVLMICALLLPLVRPEGIVVVLGIALFVTVLRNTTGKGPQLAVWLAGLGMTSIVIVTLWRLSFFGYPVPNTFYAKTSSDLVNQSRQGANYVASFLREPANVILVIGLALSIASMRSSKLLAQRFYGLFIPYLATGGFVVYTILGGDHFGSHRFFLFLVPLGLPLLAVSLVEAWKHFSDRFGTIVLGATFMLYTALIWTMFAISGGEVRHELQIAENNRQVGIALSALPRLPTVATVAAGGIKIAYAGTVYDVLGLNWTTMAHAGTVRTDVLKNHGGFNAEVFLDARPELVFPRLGRCEDGRDGVDSAFQRRVTLNITEWEIFREIYVPMCSDQIVLYADRELATWLEDQGFQFYLDSWR